jgi:hypothetical protein
MTDCVREDGDPQRRARRRAFPIQRRRATDMGPVIKDGPVRLRGRPATREGLIFNPKRSRRLCRNKKCLAVRDTASRLAFLHGVPRAHLGVVMTSSPWRTVTVFERPLWRNVAVRRDSATVVQQPSRCVRHALPIDVRICSRTAHRKIAAFRRRSWGQPQAERPQRSRHPQSGLPWSMPSELNGSAPPPNRSDLRNLDA